MSLRNYINNKRRYNEYLLINLFLATLDLRDVFFSFLFLNGGRKQNDNWFEEEAILSIINHQSYQLHQNFQPHKILINH